MSAELVDKVRLRLADGVRDPSPGDFAATARSEAGLLVDSATMAAIAGGLSADLLGAGPLEPLLAGEGVTDVLVNGADQVWIDSDSGLRRTTVRFEDDAAIRRLGARLAALAGRRLDDASPFVDATLPDGTRLHAILPPLVRHPTLALRVLTRRVLSIDDLVAGDSMPPGIAELLVSLVRAEITLLISGGTGTGKTTLLSALLSTVDIRQRILTIEDSAELAVVHPHVVALVARSANSEGAGAVGLAELVRQALRMRPDRLVVGEFRGSEIVELLAALNTGHAGGAATVHANSVRDVPARLVALASLGGMTPEALGVQAASAFEVLIHLQRTAHGREVSQIALWPHDESEPPLVWSSRAGFAPAAAEVLAARLVRAGVRLPQVLQSRTAS